MKYTIQQAQQKYNEGEIAIQVDKPDLPKLKEVTTRDNKPGFKYYYKDGFAYISTVNLPTDREIVKLSEIGEGVETESITDYSPAVKQRMQIEIDHGLCEIFGKHGSNQTESDILHPDSQALFQTVVTELKNKMIRNQQKYGYSNGWLTQDWEHECREDMIKHIQKGDPRDVAIYAMFMIYRGWSTKIESDESGTVEIDLLNRISRSFGKENFIDAYVGQDFVEEIVIEAMRQYAAPNTAEQPKECPNCKGTGYVTGGSFGDFGGVTFKEKCCCLNGLAPAEQPNITKTDERCDISKHGGELSFRKQFKKDNPQTIGETYKHFDDSNYTDWLEMKLAKFIKPD